MHVLALRFELHLSQCRSLKAKRATLRPVTEGIRARYHLSVAEVAHQDNWQQASVGVAIVSATVGQCTDIADQVERFVWSHPDLEVTAQHRDWLELDD